MPDHTRSRIAIAGAWFGDYCIELVMSVSLFLVILTLVECITFHADAFTNFQIADMCAYSLLMIAAIICMFNTAISRVALRKLADRDHKEVQ